MSEILEVTRLSNSSIDRFGQCPLSFYHAQLNPDRPAQEDVVDFYAHYGTLMHFFAEFYPRVNYYPHFDWRPSKKIEDDNNIEHVLNSYGNMLMARGQPITVDEMLAMYDSVYHLINFPDKEKHDEYYGQGVTYIKSLPSKDWSKVIGLEQYFSIDLQNGTPPLNGLIDMVERDEKGIIITDYKSSKPYSANASIKKSQLPIYGMAAFITLGEIPYKFRYDFVRFGKVVEVEIPLERMTDVKNMIRFRYMQMESYRKQGTFPAQYSDFYCKHFCGYQRLCDRYKQFNGE